MAVPELTHPGESRSNGLAERAVEALEDFSRTLFTALQAHMKIPLPIKHPLVAWVVAHAAYLLNKYQLGPDSRTAWGGCMVGRPENKYAELVNAYSGSSRSASEPSSMLSRDMAYS